MKKLTKFRDLHLGLQLLVASLTLNCAKNSLKEPASLQQQGWSGGTANCFYNHFQEAITLNQKRKLLYGELTNLQSHPISDRLMQYERLGLPLARLFDFRAKSFQSRGIGIMCEEFVSMDLAPEFSREPLPKISVPDIVSSYKPNQIREEAYKALADEGLQGMEQVIEREINLLSSTPRFMCLTRHIYESTLRAIRLAPVHEQKAAALKMESTQKLSLDFIKLQWSTLAQFHELDIEAAPIQADGIPILCNDVPPIPVNL